MPAKRKLATPLVVDDQTVHFGTSENMTAVTDSSVNLIVTSPPYWNLKDYGHENEIGKENYTDYLDRLQTVWDECYRVADDNAVLIINVANRRHQKQFYPLAFDIANRMTGWNFWDTLIWYIPNALPQANYYKERLMDNKFEFVLVFTKGDADGYTFHKPRVPQKYAGKDPRSEKLNPAGRCIGNVIRVPAYRPPNVKAHGYHVAAFPEELAALLIESYTNPGDTVLDPFVGSGTTLKVCRGMNRTGIGFEINTEYGPLIRKRILEPLDDIDWRDIDILHSATMTPGDRGTRRRQRPPEES